MPLTIANANTRDLDLLRGLPAVLDLGLVAARSAAATERVLHGQALDSIDQASLTELAALLQEAAEAVVFFESAGQSGSYPSNAVGDAVDVAIDTVLLDDTVDPANADAAQLMRSLAAQITDFSEHGGSEPATALAPVFRKLSDVLETRTGHPGETTARL